MNTQLSDFYLFYEEGYNLDYSGVYDVEIPRRCDVVKPLHIPDGSVIVEIEPPYEYEAAVLKTVVLIPRHYGVSIWPHPRTGAAVHIGMLVRPCAIQGDQLSIDRDIAIIAWGSIVADKTEAERIWSKNQCV